MAQLTLRIDDRDLPRLEAVLAALSSKLGTELARSDALRVVFARGLSELEAEHGLAPPSPEKGAAKPGKPARKK